MSSTDYMDEVWPKLAAAGVHTVLGCMSWEMIEPKEGTFVFSELDSAILGARRHGLHLILYGLDRLKMVSYNRFLTTKIFQLNLMIMTILNYESNTSRLALQRSGRTAMARRYIGLCYKRSMLLHHTITTL